MAWLSRFARLRPAKFKSERLRGMEEKRAVTRPMDDLGRISSYPAISAKHLGGEQAQTGGNDKRYHREVSDNPGDFAALFTLPV